MGVDTVSRPESGEAVAGDRRPDPVLARVRAAVEGIRFGEVRVIIQDGVIVQIERVEKYRMR